MLQLEKFLYGIGVVSDTPIAKGQVISGVYGKLVKFPQPHINNCLQVDAERVVDVNGDFDDYFNHSCDPNAVVVFGGPYEGVGELEKATTDAKLVAIKEIPAGQEITFDYSLTLFSEGFTFDDGDLDTKVCRCGAKNCRGIIGNIFTVPAQTVREFRHLIQNNYAFKKYQELIGC